jgi:hypothetical protein
MVKLSSSAVPRSDRSVDSEKSRRIPVQINLFLKNLTHLFDSRKQFCFRDRKKYRVDEYRFEYCKLESVMQAANKEIPQ